MTRAHSVGSPIALPLSSGSASEQRLMAQARSFPAEERPLSAASCLPSARFALRTTVMRFSVRVPVLSEQMT